jgi:hypothetical protein
MPSSDDAIPGRLSQAQWDEGLAELIDVPLATIVADGLGGRDPNEIIAMLAMLKTGAVANEVFDEAVKVQSQGLAGLAASMIEILVDVALENGAHKHQLASALRAIARR